LLTRTQLLRRHLAGQATPERLAEVDRIIADAKTLGDVVNDLLLSAELAGSPQAGEEVDLAAVARDVVEMLQPLAQQRSVSLTVDGDARPAAVRGAPAALRRALTSLTDNALAHTDPGGHVVLLIESQDDDVTVSVIDDGEGIDPSQAARLVERFARDTERGNGRRFGLGLALVQEVARAHGGRLEITGRPGHGARFSLRLPPSR
jgi:signal transduction histidine kinase